MSRDLVVGLVCAGVGLVGIAFVVREILIAIDSADWPTVPGEVIETGVISDVGARGGFVYSPLVRYRYKVGDQQYVNDRLSFGTMSTSFRSLAKSEAEHYRTGNKVDIHVSPRDPMNCVLEPGLKLGEILAFAVFALFFGVGVHMVAGVFGMGW